MSGNKILIYLNNIYYFKYLNNYFIFKLQKEVEDKVIAMYEHVDKLRQMIPGYEGRPGGGERREGGGGGGEGRGREEEEGGEWGAIYSVGDRDNGFTFGCDRN